VIHTLHFAVLAVACPLAAVRLARARWTWWAPRTAILCWQTLALSWTLSMVGSALATGLAPYRLGIAPALAHATGDLAAGRLVGVLGPARVGALATGVGLAAGVLGALAASTVETARVRRRHRRVLGLVARAHPDTPGALVVDHPAAAAYCQPGLPAQVVVSAGALRLLDRAELAAVLAHERAHARSRHDLVLLPFAALLRLLPPVRLTRELSEAVSLLVEMCADDAARRQHAAHPLATALLRFGAAGDLRTPAGALGVAGGVAGEVAGDVIIARVHRLLAPQPPVTWTVQALLLSAAGTAIATPISLFLLPA
jgi:Zn-dependent protease with chaperone function